MDDQPTALHDELMRIANNLHDLKTTIDQHWKSYEESSKANPSVAISDLRTQVPIRVETKPQRSKIEIAWGIIKGTLETIGIVAVIFYTYFAYHQWQEMIQARHQTQGSIDAANRNATAAEKANTEAEKRFQIDQRPYLWESSMKPLPLAVNQRVFFDLHYVNYGKSPAIRELGIGKVFFGKDALRQADKWFDKLGDKPLATPQTANGILPPGIPADPEKTVSRTTLQSDNILTNNDLAYLAIHDFAIVAVPRVDYFDAAGNFYRSDICVFQFASGAIAHCRTHNEIR